MIYTLHRDIRLALPLGEVFEFFAQAENLEKITPPWMRFQIVTPPPIEMREGATIEYKLRVHGLPMRWLTTIERWNPPFEFVDVQTRGPYKLWRHTHRFSEVAFGTLVEDIVEYELPFGPLGRLIHWLQVDRDLKHIFDYRGRQVHRLLPVR